jgi:deferrochelatase/peroxidase EfeB
LRQSHVQRANHHVKPASDRNSLRIFRQGYEFLEPLGVAPGFRAGLNFVSFQDTPERLLRILTQDSWLGGTNFGGDPDNPLSGMDRLLTVRAGGVFLAPPVTDEERFPGSSIFL